ncbi:hypothetical protein ACEQPO_13630 [Bacillus sp. SL00103]
MPLTKMAKQSHKQLHIEKDDTVVIASTPLPGQELTYSKTVDFLTEVAHKSFLHKNVCMFLDTGAKKS